MLLETEKSCLVYQFNAMTWTGLVAEIRKEVDSFKLPSRERSFRLPDGFDMVGEGKR